MNGNYWEQLVRVHFYIKLSAEKYREYYAGNVKNVQVIANDGRTIRFPANILQPYLNHDDIEGEFVIEFDDQHRFVSIKRA